MYAVRCARVPFRIVHNLHPVYPPLTLKEKNGPVSAILILCTIFMAHGDMLSTSCAPRPVHKDYFSYKRRHVNLLGKPCSSRCSPSTDMVSKCFSHLADGSRPGTKPVQAFPGQVMCARYALYAAPATCTLHVIIAICALNKPSHRFAQDWQWLLQSLYFLILPLVCVSTVIQHE